MRKFRMNKKLIIDAIISSVIVEQAPNLIRQVVNIPSGILSNVTGAAAGVLASILLKRQNISDLSIGFAGADYVNEMLGTTLLGSSSPVQDFISVGSDGKPVFALQDYTNSPEVMSTNEYQKSYAALN